MDASTIKMMGEEHGLKPEEWVACLDAGTDLQLFGSMILKKKLGGFGPKNLDILHGIIAWVALNRSYEDFKLFLRTIKTRKESIAKCLLKSSRVIKRQIGWDLFYQYTKGQMHMDESTLRQNYEGR